MKVVFIIGSVSDSHIIKRIDAFITQGYDVKVYGFERELSTTNKIKGITPYVLGNLENQRYSNRVLKIYKSVTSVINAYPKNTLFYIWGFDIALVAMLKRARFIYEISDIVYASFPSLFSKIFRFTDQKIIKSSLVTILTSEGFINYLYQQNKESDKLILLPNKLSPSILTLNRPMPHVVEKQKIRFAFMGLYRYPNTIVRLARIIGEKFPNYEFHFWGVGQGTIMQQITDLCRHFSNIYEHGPFNNPKDLPFVYSGCDIIACNYDITGINERIAEPNKLYESMYFCKPLLVSKNTFLAEKVHKLNIGYSINSLNDEEIIKFLNEINIDDLYAKALNESVIKTTNLIEDYNNLWKTIEHI